MFARMMQAAVIAGQLIVFAVGEDYRELTNSFEEWERNYAKKYPTAEERDLAFMTWVSNLKTVEMINSDPKSTWTAKLNAFADMSTDKFSRHILMDHRNPPIRPASTKSWTKQKSKTLPLSYDWREFGAVTPVHDQGTVGTCWAFSTIGNIEGQWFLSTGDLTDLSEEYLVDCDGTSDGTHADCGVFGGWPYLAYQYIIENGGVPTEETWPYCSGNGSCYPCMQGPISLCGPPPYYW